jgi:hypothetical protein
MLLKATKEKPKAVAVATYACNGKECKNKKAPERRSTFPIIFTAARKP